MNSFAFVGLGLCIAFFPVTASISALADDVAPIVTNFKFGLVCGSSDNRRVCFQTNIIQITNESNCIFNHSPIRCTWYGYSFDYDAAADVTINCELSTDVIMNEGNPNEMLKPAQNFEFDLALKKGAHHFFVAQYISGEKDDHSAQQGKESCSFAGKPLFSAEFQYEFADKTEPVDSVPDVSGQK